MKDDRTATASIGCLLPPTSCTQLPSPDYTTTMTVPNILKSNNFDLKVRTALMMLNRLMTPGIFTGADSADDYVQVELERRMWSSTSADISRATDSTDRVATCAICLDEMDHVSCVTFPCGHSLHKSCAQTSEKYSILDNGCYLCPECREDVSFFRVIFISSDHEVWRTDTSSSSSAVAFATNFSTVEAAAELSANGGNNMVISSHSPPVQYLPSPVQYLPSPDLSGQLQTRSQPSQQMSDIIMVSNSVSATGRETNNLATTQDHHHQHTPAAFAAFATGGLGLIGARVGGGGVQRRASGLQSQFNLLKSNVAFWGLFQEMLDASPELYALGPGPNFLKSGAFRSSHLRRCYASIRCREADFCLFSLFLFFLPQTKTRKTQGLILKCHFFFLF